MIEEPPPLPFPSLTKLKAPAKEILDAQRNPTSPDVEFKFFQPVDPTSETDKKKIRPNKKACDICKKKKVKCDNNVIPNEVCTRATCPCIYHVPFIPTAAEDESKTTNNSNNGDKGKSVSSSNADSAYFDNKRLSSSTSISSTSTSIPTTTAGNGLNNNNIDTIPSTTVFRKPGLLYSGHYAGETSFCGYLAPESQPPVITEEDQFPTFDPTPPQPPYISEQDQLYLIDVYYENINPFFPILNKEEMILQHGLVMNNGLTYLSPLFFHALFARAAHVETSRIWTQQQQQQHQNQQSFNELGDECINYVSALANCYKDKPRISTILALIIMANHLEQTKLPEKLTRSWLWAGEAFRIALDLGVHRSLISEENEHLGQLCIRTFWLAYITDCTMSMTYGRPSATEEKVLDVTSPKRINTDDDCTAEWLEGLNVLISLSKIAARVIKFNYCPPPPFKIQGPVKRHNAFLASVDSWLTDIMHPNSNEPDSPISNAANVIHEESIMSKRMSLQKMMFLYTNLILLHRPYVNDSIPARNSVRPSYDICTFAAILVTDIASKLEHSELVYHSKSPMIAYALVMALRVHIMNAYTNPSVDKFNAEKNFTKSIATLNKLPQSQNRSSLLYEALADLKEQYNNRFTLSQEKEEEIRSRQQQLQQQQQQQQQQIEQLTITPAEAIFNPASIEKRKERPCSVSSTDTSSINGTTSNTNLSVKYYQPPNETTTARKKKKAKTAAGPAPTATFADGQQKQKMKQKQIQQSHQHVFSTNTTTTAGSSSSTNSSQQTNNQAAAEQQRNQTQSLQVALEREYQQQQQQQQYNQQYRMQQQQPQQHQQQYIPQQQQQVSFTTASGSNTGGQANNNSSNVSYSHIDYSTLVQQQLLMMTETQQLFQQQDFTLSDEVIMNLGFFGIGGGDSSSTSSNSNYTPQQIPNDDMSYDTFMKNYSMLAATAGGGGGGGGGGDELANNDSAPIWCVSNENNSGVSITPATGYNNNNTNSTTMATGNTNTSSPALTYATSSVNNTVHGGSPSTTYSFPNSSY